MRQQKALTIITRLKPDADNIKDLGEFLHQIGHHKKNPYVRFDEIGTTCFAAWILLNNDPHYPPSLVFECNHEGDVEEYLNDFISHAGPALHRIYRHCMDYTAARQNDAYLKTYLKAHRQDYAAFYIGCPYQSQHGILESARARSLIQKFVGPQSKGCDQPQELRRDIEQRLRNERIGSFDGLITPLWKLRARVFLNLLSLAAVILLGIFILYRLAPSVLEYSASLLVTGIIALLLIIRIKEIREPKPDPNRYGKIDPLLFRSEDIFQQNHLTTLVEIKPGIVSPFVLKVWLWIINAAARLRYITGHLGGIPTIHFARWLIIDTDMPIQRLLFLSNFDGSWHSYLGDFVDKAAFGLNGIWGNTVEFPPTKFLFGGGANQIVEFKQWSRDHNLYTHVWYEAYQVTVKNILKNVEIADKIGKDLSPAATNEWLSLL